MLLPLVLPNAANFCGLFVRFRALSFIERRAARRAFIHAV